MRRGEGELIKIVEISRREREMFLEELNFQIAQEGQRGL